MVVSTRIRREGGALHVFSVQNFVRVGRSAGVVHALRGDFAAISVLRAAKGVVFGSRPRRAGEGTCPYGGYRDVPVFLAGAGPRPARGRPRCAAPTVFPEAVPFFVGAGHWPARLETEHGSRRAGEGTRPYGGCRDVSVFLVGAGPRPARGRGKPLPYGDQKTFRVCVGEPLGAPAKIRTRSVG